MTDPRETLAEIQARAEKATPGPWEDWGGVDANGVTRASGPITWDDHGGEVFKPADADFIAHARTDVPVMAAALTAALHALDDLDSKHQIHGHECLCGFASARSRSRTEHLTAEVRAAITTALQGETP